MSAEKRTFGQKLKRGWRLFDVYTDAIAGVFGVFAGIVLLLHGVQHDKHDWWMPPVALIVGVSCLFNALRSSGGWLRRRR